MAETCQPSPVIQARAYLHVRGLTHLAHTPNDPFVEAARDHTLVIPKLVDVLAAWAWELGAAGGACVVCVQPLFCTAGVKKMLAWEGQGCVVGVEFLETDGTFLAVAHKARTVGRKTRLDEGVFGEEERPACRWISKQLQAHRDTYLHAR